MFMTYACVLLIVMEKVTEYYIHTYLPIIYGVEVRVGTENKKLLIKKKCYYS